VKVIKSGDGRKGWAREETCTGQGNGIDGCGAELLLEENDLYHTRNTDYGGDSYTFTTFRCCECGNETDITNVPSNVK